MSDQHNMEPVPQRTQQDELETEKNQDMKLGEYDVNVHVLPVANDLETTEKSVDSNLAIGADEQELQRLQASLHQMTMDRTLTIISELIIMHDDDPNFSSLILQDMKTFVTDPNIADNPEKHQELVDEMKLQAVLATENSPYLEVRANVDPTDDPDLPVSTVRAWVLGCLFCAVGCFVDNLFAFRNPSITIGTNVAQLVAYPLGKFLARVLPDYKFHIFGTHSLNPGPFNRKEHMLISIMANISFVAPYTNYIVPVQAMPQYFNMPFAYDRGYQLILSLSINLFGYGLAGMLRRFLVYPSVAIWPANLAFVALIKAFHDGRNEPVRGPFNRIYTASREKIFLVATLGMFLYYFFPGFIFQALSSFSWITWIAPDNIKLDAVFGIYGGLGLNPWPTFDWNMFGGTGLYLPTFAVVNMVVGMFIAAMMILALWFTNTWNTAFLPINSNKTFDNTGSRYNVTSILNSQGDFDQSLYQAYSKPYFSAGYIVYNIWAFAQVTSAFTYVVLFHRREVFHGFKGIYRNFFKKRQVGELEEDIHYRLMQVYKEVPDWWYALLTVIPIGLGCAAVKGYPTNAPVSAVFYGLIMPFVFIVPIGIIQAVTGVSVPLNVLGAVIGGAINAGNANGLIFFKVWAYLSSWQALSFVSDLKLAHYLKIPPRITFSAQIVSTIILAVVTSLQFNFIMGIKNVCTSDAPFHFTCPPQQSFYTITIFWGVISPKKLFGPGQQYNMMLLGFPLGVIMVLIYWGLRRSFPRSFLLRQVHPVMIASGPVTMAAPYNLAYYIGNLYVNLFSFHYIRRHYPAFWAKWNYVISAAFSCGLAFSALVIFFALQIPKGGLSVDWWGNTVTGLGCEGDAGCPLYDIPDSGYFGPTPGTYT